jgi:hypothetical protein
MVSFAISITAVAFIHAANGFLPTRMLHIHNPLQMALPASEQERLLRTEPAQTAFIVAEMRSFLTSALERVDSPSGHIYDTKWEMSMTDKLAANLIDADGKIINQEYTEAQQLLIDSDGGAAAIDILCNTTAFTFKDGFTNQPGLLSALGSAICYFRDAYRTPKNLAACERVGLSDYAGELLKYLI